MSIASTRAAIPSQTAARMDSIALRSELHDEQRLVRCEGAGLETVG